VQEWVHCSSTECLWSWNCLGVSSCLVALSGAWQYSPGCLLTHVALQVAEVLRYSHVNVLSTQGDVVAPVLQYCVNCWNWQMLLVLCLPRCACHHSVARLLFIKGLVWL
jgi:hypothetical protein